jgi:hypothetical protein
MLGGLGGQERSDSGVGPGGQERSDSGVGPGGQERSDSGWTRRATSPRYRRMVAAIEVSTRSGERQLRNQLAGRLGRTSARLDRERQFR